jgi:hypothetical protein
VGFHLNLQCGDRCKIKEKDASIQDKREGKSNNNKDSSVDLNQDIWSATRAGRARRIVTSDI